MMCASAMSVVYTVATCLSLIWLMNGSFTTETDFRSPHSLCDSRFTGFFTEITSYCELYSL